MKRLMAVCTTALLMAFCAAQVFAFALTDLDFTFEGLSPADPILFSTAARGPITANQAFHVTLGQSFNLVAEITNLTNAPITFIVSNPPTAIPPHAADVILSGFFSAQIPLGGHFGGPVIEFAGTSPFGGNGDLFTLAAGSTITTLWGSFNGANVVPDGDISDLVWGAPLSAMTGAYLASNNQLAELFLNQPFYVTFTAPIPEPATLALLALGLAGFGFSRRKVGVRQEQEVPQ